MIRTLALLLAILGGQASAQSLPALYDVAGVAADDVLNIRASDSANSAVIGEILPNTKHIEVVATNDAQTWGLINANEQSGWVSLRYLLRQPGQSTDDFPPITSCYGTEPFWDLSVRDDLPVFSLLGEQPQPLTAIAPIRSENRIDRFSFITPNFVAFISRQMCQDGMSDRQFGLSVEAILAGDGPPIQLSGCCSLQP